MARVQPEMAKPWDIIGRLDNEVKDLDEAMKSHRFSEVMKIWDKA